MTTLYRIIPDDPDSHWYRISYDWQAADWSILWRGERLSSLPRSVRFNISLARSDLPDLIRTPCSWDLFSGRAAAVISRIAGHAVQLFDAPLYNEMTGEPVGDYKIVNATRAIP